MCYFLNHIFVGGTWMKAISLYRCGLLALALLLAAPAVTRSSVITFGSDTSWDVYDADSSSGSANLLGQAEYVTINSGVPNIPTGAVNFGYPDGGLWLANRSSIPGAQWVWAPNSLPSTLAPDYQKYYFSKTFTFDTMPTAGTLSVAVDDLSQVFVNGVSLGTYGSVTVSQQTSQNSLKTYNILPELTAGLNTITIMGENGPGTFSAYYVSGQPVTYHINPAGVVFGGSITVPAVPEPASLAIGGVGIGLMLLRRRPRWPTAFANDLDAEIFTEEILCSIVLPKFAVACRC
jgi:hypothetical protein